MLATWRLPVCNAADCLNGLWTPYEYPRKSINLCIRSIGTEQDWRTLYELSFPRDERMSLEELDVMIKRQLVLVHRTTDSEGNLLCFSYRHSHEQLFATCLYRPPT